MKPNIADHFRYLTVSPSDLAWGLVCTSVGYRTVPSRNSEVPHPPLTDLNPTTAIRTKDEYQLVYITNGSGIFRSSRCPSAKISAGTVIMTFPGEWYAWDPDGNSEWSEFRVAFKGTIADLTAANGFLSRDEPLCRVGISNTLTRLYEDMINYAGKQKNGFQQVISGIVQHIIGYVSYRYQNRHHEDSELLDKVDRAKAIMSGNITGTIRVTEVAEAIGMGYTWFRRIFKEYTGFSPAQYLLQLRHARAKEMLACTRLPVSEIANRLGFDSISQFSTFFSKREGMTATEFRVRNSMTYLTKE